jgi:predicted ABC-type ATPase
MTDAASRDPLRAVVFAGPNGSGKSTITTALVENPALFRGEYINADNIAKSFEEDIPNYIERNIRAANVAEERRLTAFREHRSVAFERSCRRQKKWL